MEQATAKTVLLMGRPGSGKGTQAKLLADAFGWKHFCTGNIFKELREGEGALSARVREAYDSGRLFPDWFATYLFEDAMLKLDSAQGVVIEGYPRSLPQAQIYDETMDWLARPYIAFDINVSDEETIRRQVERAKTEHRPDSATEEQARIRLDQYKTTTEPVLAYLTENGTLISIDGMPDIETIHADILTHLG